MCSNNSCPLLGLGRFCSSSDLFRILSNPAVMSLALGFLFVCSFVYLVWIFFFFFSVFCLWNGNGPWIPLMSSQLWDDNKSSLAKVVLWSSLLTPAFGSLRGSSCASTVAELLFPSAEGDQKCFARRLRNHFKQISVMRFWSHMALELEPSSAGTACCNCSSAVLYKEFQEQRCFFLCLFL